MYKKKLKVYTLLLILVLENAKLTINNKTVIKQEKITMYIYYDFPNCEDFEFEITPDKFEDYIKTRYTKADVIDLIMNFYWDNIDDEEKVGIISECDFNPAKPHESDEDAYELFMDILYDNVEDFEGGLSEYFVSEAKEECQGIQDKNWEFDNSSRWY